MKRFVSAGHPESQGWLLPPSIEEFVPQDSPVRSVSKLIDELDLCHLRDLHKGGGRPAYDPVMLVKVLIFGMMHGIRSSRKLEETLRYDLRFMFLAHMATPDYRTIARFRAGSESTLADVFVRTVKLAQQRGMVALEHVSIDGTKLCANAGKRACRSEKELEAGIEKVDKIATELLAQWEQNDDQEQSNDEGQPPGAEPRKQLASLTRRKARLEAAKTKLKETGNKTVIVSDEESRMMKTAGVIRPAYNAQAVVDDKCQVIIVSDVSQDVADNALLPIMLESTKAAAGAHPKRVSADAGY